MTIGGLTESVGTTPVDQEGRRSQQGWPANIGATKGTAGGSPLTLCPRDSETPEPPGNLPTLDSDFSPTLQIIS